MDQRAALSLVALTRRVAGLIRALRPAMVLTHAYEGGHPDHDAAAFVAARAVHQIEPGSARPALLEFPSYRLEGDRVVTNRFLPDGRSVAHARPLSDAERFIRERMLDAFVTQRAVIEPFRRQDHEWWRAAPQYDFTAPPHPGPLHYERFHWGMTSTRWCELATDALNALRHAR
jgi:LmbE family N-acetylglucosaminyl deacetylase